MTRARDTSRTTRARDTSRTTRARDTSRTTRARDTSRTTEAVLVPGGAELADHRDALLTLWVEVTEAGGAVGFRAPVTREEVARVVDPMLAEVADGRAHVVVAAVDGELVGLVTVVPGPAPRFGHRVTLRRLLVHPRRQGEGLGARLVATAHDLARDLGAELVLVEVRDGLGLDRFYARLGYVEVGRIPGGLAFEDGDRVDELFLACRLV